MWDFDDFIPTIIRCMIYWTILVCICLWSEYKENIKKYGIKKSILMLKESTNISFGLIVFLYFLPALIFCIFYFIANLF